MEYPSDMLPPISELLEDLRLGVGDPKASGKDIKLKMTQLTTQINRESTEGLNRDTKWARLEGDALGCTSDALGYIWRSLRTSRPKMENALLDGKVLINSREVLSRIQKA